MQCINIFQCKHAHKLHIRMPNIHIYVHTYFTDVFTYIHTRTRTHSQNIHKHAYTRTHTRTTQHKYTYINTHSHAYTCTTICVYQPYMAGVRRVGGGGAALARACVVAGKSTILPTGATVVSWEGGVAAAGGVVAAVASATCSCRAAMHKAVTSRESVQPHQRHVSALCHAGTGLHARILCTQWSCWVLETHGLLLCQLHYVIARSPV